MANRDPEKRRRSNRRWNDQHPEYYEAYRQNHTEQFAAYNKTYRQKQTDAMLSWYERYKKKMRCHRCPESREPCLDFHHIDPSTKKFEIKKMMKKGSCSLETLLQEVHKCEVLCANCHRIHHWEERNRQILK
jgi:hypothetical protein